MGLIEEATAEGPRKAFEVTDEGRAHLEENADEVEALFERLEGPAPATTSQPAAATIGRAVGNLMTALRHRVAHDGWTRSCCTRSPTILDEAAQRIERVK